MKLVFFKFLAVGLFVSLPGFGLHPDPMKERLCDYVMRELEGSRTNDRVGVIVESVVRFGARSLEIQGEAAGKAKLPHLLAPRGNAYSFHGYLRPLFALQLPTSSEATPIGILSIAERRQLIERLRKTIAKNGAYRDTSREKDEEIAKAGLGPTLIELMQSPERYSTFSNREGLAMLGSGLLWPIDSSPFYDFMRKLNQKYLNENRVRAAAAKDAIVPTLLSPSGYFANAFFFGDAGVCRHGAMGVTALHGELGGSDKDLQFQMGIGLGAHAWVKHRKVPYLPMIPVDSTPSRKGEPDFSGLPATPAPLIMPVFNMRSRYHFLEPHFTYLPD